MYNFNFNCQLNLGDLFISGSKFNNTSRNNWKPLFDLNFSKNSSKTIGLCALDFYEAIVDEAESQINYHLIEISSS